MESKFFKEIKNAKIEREVEAVYNKGISLYFLKDNNGIIEHPYACDGLVTIKNLLKLLIEYKFNEDLQKHTSQARILVQVLYYLKKFDTAGDPLPNVIMVGDKDAVFVLHVNDIQEYLDEDIDWNIAPCDAYKSNPDLIKKIYDNDKINPFVFPINKDFSFKEVADRIKDLAINVQRHVRITEHNISKIFDYFTANVILNSAKIPPNDLVGIFISAIIDKTNCYKHPNMPNILISNGQQIPINSRCFDAFFKYFEKEYTPVEKNKFTEISDRLIEDTKRRRSGEFYTPTLFTDYAHKMLSAELGDDWKEKYVVWDCCWGTGNLTRDYQFKELYASTLEQAELNCGQRYNPEATKFVFDFLNDEISNLFECKLPAKLVEALEQNKPILFFINPPYATAGVNNETSKKGCAKTIINKKMKEHKMSGCAQNLYAQFLYRIILLKEEYKLSNIHIGIFCPTLFLTGTSYKEFRKVFLNHFKLSKAIQFKASYFADVADYWGISFSVWNPEATIDRNNFQYSLIEEINGEIIKTKQKIIYNLDEQETSKSWAKDNSLKNNIQTICLKSAINPSSRIKGYPSEALGVLIADSNNIDKNMQYVTILNSNMPNNLGSLYISPHNFEKCMALCAARKLIFGDWINSKDEYCAPNETHLAYQTFINDSIIFSLFHSGAGQASCQTSLRNLEADNRLWNIKNEFFYMSKETIKQLANEFHFDDTYNQARVEQERFTYLKLRTLKLSPEAKTVLDKAIELTKKSFKFRSIFNEEHPEYQIMNWDCGWYQVKALLKEYFPDDLKDFQESYKILADKMRPLVYELGFLKNTIY